MRTDTPLEDPHRWGSKLGCENVTGWTDSHTYEWGSNFNYKFVLCFYGEWSFPKDSLEWSVCLFLSALSFRLFSKCQKWQVLKHPQHAGAENTSLTRSLHSTGWHIWWRLAVWIWVLMRLNSWHMNLSSLGSSFNTHNTSLRSKQPLNIERIFIWWLDLGW